MEAKVNEMKSKGLEPVWMKRVDPDLKMSFRLFKDCDDNLIQFVELMPEAKKRLKQLEVATI